MTTPTTDDELRMVHAALHIEVPFDQASPLILATLKTIAHCWRGRVPPHLFGMPAQKPPGKAQPGKPAVTDFKRRASGDFD